MKISFRNKIKKLISFIGPGFITGASDDDPSGIATYSQTGAQFGLGQLWTALFSVPFMIVIQEMCGRIGLVTGKGLAGVMRLHYGRWLLYFCVGLLFLANTINIGADLGAMAEALGLLVPISFPILLLLLTVVTLLLEVFVSYRVYVRFLKYLALSLIAYIITAFVVEKNWFEVMHSLVVPHFSWTKDYLMNIVALLGTTISPYLFFWQADEEVEEEVLTHKLKDFGQGVPKVTRGDFRHLTWDTVLGMVFSNVVTFFIIVTTAATFWSHGITTIETAPQAAEALRPLAGRFASLLFTVGIIGTGLLSVPVLAGSASYAVAEASGWRSGLYRKFSQAHGFYGVISLATVAGLIINFVHIPPFKMLYYTAILNGLIAPILMIVILCLANNKKIMGAHTNSRLSNILGITITVFMALCSLVLLYVFFV